jgi:hypothetical protein
VRICPFNDDSEPLLSDGTQFSFTTTEQPLMHVNGLGCDSNGNATFWGTGDSLRYRFTRVLTSSASTAPDCTQSSSTLQIYGSSQGSWTGNISPNANEQYWVRVCYLRTDGTFDQGQVVNITAPQIIGGAYYYASCTPNPKLESPYISFQDPAGYTTSGTTRTVHIQGDCRYGSTVHLDGDVVHQEVACDHWDSYYLGQFDAIATIGVTGDGPIRIIGTDWQQGVEESAPWMRTLNL